MKILKTTAAEALLVKGPTASGKTEALVGRVAELLGRGADPASIAVFAATPQAAREFSARLSACLDEDVAAPLVTTPREVAMGILSQDVAMEMTGRRPRLLTAFEQNAFFEDMKTSGTKPGRIKEIMSFFRRSWTVCDDFHDAWLVNDEERGLHAAAKGYLAMTAGLLEPEVSNLALRVLLADPRMRESRAWDHVLVDDYQLLSRASQLLVNALARLDIAVAANPADTLEVFESFPFAQGVEELLELNKGARVVELEGRGAPASCEVTTYAGAAEEMDALVARVKGALDAGVAPRDIYVVAQSKVLRSTVMRVLGKAGVAVETLASDQVLSNDLRDMTRCKNARLYTLLCLAADENDAVAWRSWCGFGDALLNNSAFMALRAYCEESDTDMLGALHALALRRVHDGEEGFVADGALADLAATLGMEDVVSSYMRGRILLKRIAGLKGAALLEALEDAVSLGGDDKPSTVVAQLSGGVSEQDGAAEILARINGRIEFP